MKPRSLFSFARAAFAALWLLAFAPLASAFTIALDFDTFYSQGASTFFDAATTSGSLARATVQKAAADISAVLADTPLAALQSSYTFKGSTFSWYLNVSDPYGIEQSAREISAPLSADIYTIYVGAQTLPGNTLGQGGPVGWGGGTSYNTLANLSRAIGEFNLASAGRGPQMGTLSFNNALITDPVSGLMAGRLWFDDDSNWTLDWQAAVAAGTSDLYSVALHEILHTLGFGTGLTWNALVDKVTGKWTGEDAEGTPIDTASWAHLAKNTMSVDIYDGNVQEVAMDPDITVGTRKYLTATDLAVLRDMGYVVSIPEPSAFILLGLGLGAALVARRRLAA